MPSDIHVCRPECRRPMLVLIAVFVGILLLAGALPAQEAQEKRDQAPPPAPSKEGFSWGVYDGRSEIEVGYRWVTTAGNSDVYRSMVNLGEGPKLLRSNVSLRSNYGAGLVFDHLDFSMDNWGGDPYNTMRLSFGRTGTYEVRAVYLNQNYYNFLPTWANPLLQDGKTLSQHGLDVGYRNTDVELKLFTTYWVRPFFGYARSSGFGPGFTTESFTGNEFLLRQNWRYSANDYRGGLEFALPRTIVSLEQGFRFLQNDSSAYYTGDSTGNNPRPFLGQPIVQTDQDRGYQDRTNIPIFKGVLSTNPFSWLKFTGRYIYAMGDTEGTMSEIAAGNLVSLENRIAYRAQSDAFDTRAKKPSQNGSFVLEISPLSRLNIIDHFETRRFHVSGAGLLASTYYQARSLVGGSGVVDEIGFENTADSYLAYDWIRNAAEVEVGIWGNLYARGGYRYSSTKATIRDTDPRFTRTQSASVVQKAALAGVTYRQKGMRLGVDFEKNEPDDSPVVRTDLFDYYRVNFDWNLGPWKGFSFKGNVALLDNENAHEDIDLTQHNRNYSFAVNYAPSDRYSLSLDYTRSSIFSDLAILLPQTLAEDRSVYDERSHGIGAGVGIGVYRGSRLDLGYRGILSSGSYPLNYHQPYASLHIPLRNHLAVRTNWQYYGYNEKSVGLQDWRGHLVTVSLALSY